MAAHCVDDLRSEGSQFYRAAMTRLKDHGVPFRVGGAYALEGHTGIVRRTKDLDIFVKPGDVGRVMKIFAEAGYQTELAFPHWIAKAFCGDDFIDIIFNSGNGVCPVDEEWFEHAREGTVLGVEVKLSPAEEAIWQKSFILERDRCDVADVTHLIRHCSERLDWRRLLVRFGDRWRVLLAQLTLFGFIYPGHRGIVPRWVMSELIQRLQNEVPPRGLNHECHGTLLSATQYLRDIDMEGYRDGRLIPLGNMTQDEIAVWTANFMQPK